MILRIMGIEEDVVFDDCHDTLLVISDSKFYASFINLLNLISKGFSTSNEIVLLNNDTNILSSTEIVFDPFNLTINSKKILSLLYKKIDTEISSDEYLMSFYKCIAEINDIAEEYINDFNVECIYNTNPSFADYLKFIDLKIEENRDASLREKIINYLEVNSELFTNKVFIFCNVLSYLSEEDIAYICKYKNFKHIFVLFIENNNTNKYNFQTYIIDNDLYLYKKNICF